ncbi:MAG: HK97 family phage prohead protease [Planctomycetota bacterium]
MPTPHPKTETLKEWMKRCVPQVIEDGTADDNQQAVAICSSMWRQATRSKAMRMRYLDCNFEIKQVADEGSFIGYASTYGNIDEGGDKVARGAFKDSLAERQPRMFWMHDIREPVGAWTKITDNAKGLKVEGQLALGTQRADEARVLMAMQPPAVSGLSIGFLSEDSDIDKRTGVRTIKKAQLFEISIVSMPMNDRAQISAVKALIEDGETPSRTDFEAILRDAGLSHTKAKLVMSLGYKGLLSRNDDTDLIETIKKTTEVLSL